jgi:hypothetical protein
MKPEKPHPAKATLCLPSPKFGEGIKGWGTMAVTNYTDMILSILYTPCPVFMENFSV